MHLAMAKKQQEPDTRIECTECLKDGHVSVLVPLLGTLTLDGYEAAREVRELRCWRGHTFAIALSSRAVR